MKSISLNGLWDCQLMDGSHCACEVPGCYDGYTQQKDSGAPVWFTRSVTLPDLEYERYFLRFGAVSYYCELYVNDALAGAHEGMWDSFRIDVTKFLRPGENQFKLMVQKPGYRQEDRFRVREVLSGFIPDVLCTFGGMWDDVSLECCNALVVHTHSVTASIDGSLDFHIRTEAWGNAERVKVTGEILAPDGSLAAKVAQCLPIEPGVSQVLHVPAKLEHPVLWEMDAPNLYTYRLELTIGAEKTFLSKRFGIREIKAQGSKLLLNGRPIFARGVLHWGYYDDAIIPNPDRKTIQAEIDAVKAHGFNMIKHCLYVPREEYFELADENGVLLWVELPLWLPDVTPQLPERIQREYPLILEQIAGHASVIMLSLGCELDARVDSSILEEMYHLAKRSSSALVRDNSGSGECYDGLPVDFADFFDYHFYADLQNMEPLMEAFTPSWRNYRPWLFGEFCDSDTMRDLRPLRAAKNGDKLMWELADPVQNPISSLKPDFRMPLYDQRMEENGIFQDYDEISKLSLDHAMVHRKVNLEYVRSFAELAGYNITVMRDVPIATSGIFDDRMQPKFDAEQFKTFNSDIVLAPAWDLTRIWLNADRLKNKERYNFFGGEYYGLHVLLSNYSKHPLIQPSLDWQLREGGQVVAQGSFEQDGTYANGEVSELGYIGLHLPQTDRPKTMLLTVQMRCGEQRAANQWPVFLYPRPEQFSAKIGLYDPAGALRGIDSLCAPSLLEDEREVANVDVVLTTRLTPSIRRFIERGGKALFLQRGEGYLPSQPVAFWREGMVRCYPHPVLKGLERQTWMDDLRFFSLSTDTALQTSAFGELGITDARPIIRRYDCREWLATDYMVDCRLGKGRLIATTLRFEGGMGKQPMFVDGNCFGVWLLHQAITDLQR